MSQSQGREEKDSQTQKNSVSLAKLGMQAARFYLDSFRSCSKINLASENSVRLVSRKSCNLVLLSINNTPLCNLLSILCQLCLFRFFVVYADNSELLGNLGFLFFLILRKIDSANFGSHNQFFVKNRNQAFPAFQTLWAIFDENVFTISFGRITFGTTLVLRNSGDQSYS